MFSKLLGLFLRYRDGHNKKPMCRNWSVSHNDNYWQSNQGCKIVSDLFFKYSFRIRCGLLYIQVWGAGCEIEEDANSVFIEIKFQRKRKNMNINRTDNIHIGRKKNQKISQTGQFDKWAHLHGLFR